MKTLLLAVCGLAATVNPLSAQQRPRSDSLPRELVQALLGGALGGMRVVDVQTGLADDSLPPALFQDATVLGFADFRMSTTTVVYFPYAPEQTVRHHQGPSRRRRLDRPPATRRLGTRFCIVVWRAIQ